MPPDDRMVNIPAVVISMGSFGYCHPEGRDVKILFRLPVS